jgi:hypothetical protein
MLSTRLVTLLLSCVLLPLSSPAQAPEPPQAEGTPPPLIQAPQEEPTSEAPPAPEAGPAPETPQGELIPREHTPGTQKPVSQRVPVQLLVGTAAAAGAMLLAYGVMETDPQDCDGSFCDYSVLFLGLGVGAVGLTVGPPLAIWLVGERYEGRGRFWPTLAGGALGTLGSILSLVALPNDTPPELAIAVAGIWPVLGSMILHELTRLPSYAPSDSGARVIPVVSVSRHGGLVGGLVGTF